MISIALIWSSLLGIIPLLIAIYTIPFSRRFNDRMAKMDDPFFASLGSAFYYAPPLIGFAGILNLLIAIVSLIAPHLQLLINTGVIISPLLLITSIGLFLRTLTADPDHDRRQEDFVTVVITLIVTSIILGGAIWFNIILAKAPFVYDDVQLVQTTYCPGDNLVIQFSGTSAADGRNFIIGGFITNTTTGQRYFYDDIFVPGTVGQAQYFPAITYTDRLIPNVPTGQYTYHHNNRAAGGTASDSFVTDPFTVIQEGCFND